MNKPTFRRIMAYIFDIIIITIIVSALSSIKLINPYHEKYGEAVESYESYVNELYKNPQNITNMFNDEEAVMLVYNVAHYGVYTNIISLVVTFLYFVVFQYYTGGKTAGKKIMGIEVVTTKGKKLEFKQLLIRSAVFNSLITSSILVICVLTLKVKPFTTASSIIEMIDFGLILACIAMVIYRADGVGLHDYLAKTRVILSSEKELLNKKPKEAKIVEKEN